MLNIRILVVDDHGTLRKRIADYLRAQEGVEEVAEAANGVEALKCLRESHFDVMITDLVMPLMDGYMLLEELPRQIDPPPKTIVMSALSRDDFVTRAIDLGAVFYMVKPFEPSTCSAISVTFRRSAPYCPRPRPLSSPMCRVWTSGWGACF